MTSNADLLNSLKIDRNAAPPASSRKGLWIGVAVAAAVVVIAGGAFALRGGKAMAVQVTEATAIGAGGSSNASVLDATGYVVARRMATVSAKVTGKVREILIEEGQHVETGQVLARLDPVDANAQRTLSAAQLSAAQSQSASVQAQLKQAEADAARLSSLVKQQLVSRAQFDQAIAARDALRAQLVTSQRNAQVARDGLQIAANGVDNTIVRAPFAGVVIAKAAQPGEIVSPLSAGGGFTRTGIGTIVDMDSLEVEVDVNEAFLQKVVADAPTIITLNAYPDWKIPGKVIAIIPTADRSKATVKVRVAFGEKDARVLPDMGARVAFLPVQDSATSSAPKISGVLIPSNAVLGSDTVFVLKDGAIARRNVKVSGNGAELKVESGVIAGETVVLEPQSSWADGLRVRVQ